MKSYEERQSIRIRVNKVNNKGLAERRLTLVDSDSSDEVMQDAQLIEQYIKYVCVTTVRSFST
jgi:hypothetical protein